ncbi:MAG: radical SAM protein [Bacteroidota bacterium]|nr:radical SAM protein [Bacteroidota bacterium]
MSAIRPVELYRLPWSLTDNAISWLEPTSACNLACEGCYRENRKFSHKPLDVVARELDVFARLRRADSISIAGGEPLAHPDIVAIVRMVKERGWKAVINSNGALLTPELLRELAAAGVDGFTFHVDSKQNRPGWKDADEEKLNALRLRLAEMLAAEGNITCSFNATVYPDTLKDIPLILRWAQEHIDIVHVVVFILYRNARLASGFHYYVGAQRVELDGIAYGRPDDPVERFLHASDALEAARTGGEEITPCAYLGGTEQPDSTKWLLSLRVGTRDRIFGYTGPKFMELVQVGYHFLHGKYLAYASPKTQRRGRVVFLAAPIDRRVRRICGQLLRHWVKSPASFFRRVHFQSIMIIQPADVDDAGRINMCDGCPDITVWEDRLVWSCRLEEQYRWGVNMHLVRKETAPEDVRLS